jgi:curved DNA-binding protein CbpA
MERYYSILGIPNNSSKDVVKKAYYTKMKALHPDKIHGTALEDTATFFTTEINEAYNQLMAQFKENNTSANQNNQPAFIEEKIYVENKGYLQYTISNNLDVIVNEIYNRLRCQLPDTPSQIPWNINPDINQNVKDTMNKHNMNYSTTSLWEGSTEYVVINKRQDNNWYVSGYKIKSQQNNTTQNTQAKYKPSYKKNKTKERNYIGIYVKLIVVAIIFIAIFNYFNIPQPPSGQPQANYSRNSQVFANVVSCDWLNVRKTPSSANNSNIIDAIKLNTRVEVIEKANNGWARIKYSNGKTGYVHSGFLSR